MCFFFNPGPVRRVLIPNRYTAKAKLCFCKNNKRRIIREEPNPPNHTCPYRRELDIDDHTEGLATLDINGSELLAKHATVRPADLTYKDLGSGKL